MFISARVHFIHIFTFWKFSLSQLLFRVHFFISNKGIEPLLYKIFILCGALILQFTIQFFYTVIKRDVSEFCVRGSDGDCCFAARDCIRVTSIYSFSCKWQAFPVQKFSDGTKLFGYIVAYSKKRQYLISNVEKVIRSIKINFKT